MDKVQRSLIEYFLFILACGLVGGPIAALLIDYSLVKSILCGMVAGFLGPLVYQAYRF